MSKRILSLLLVLFLIGSVAMADSVTTMNEPAYAAYNGKNIAVQTGTVSGEQALAVLPDAQISYFNTQTDALTALLTGKVDAYCTDEPIIRFMMISNPELEIINDFIDTISLAAIFPKTEAGQVLRDQYSAFVDDLWANGTMAEIDAKWFGADEEKYTVLDYESLPPINGTLRMAVDTSLVPFVFIRNNRIVGYDVDIASRFCESYGYQLEIVPMDFAGVLSSVQSGKVDFADTDITITEERAESVLFSSPNYKGGTALAIRKDDKNLATENSGRYTSLSSLKDARIGVQTGSTFDEIVLESFPDAKIYYFSTYPDMVTALETNKIDGFPGDEPVLQLMAAENNKLTILDERMDNFEFGFVMPKTEVGKKLLDEFNVWLSKIKANGELDEIISKWISGSEENKTLPDYSRYPAPKGTLKLATEGAYAPMNYYRCDEVIGFEIDLAAQFCEANGYGLVVEVMNFDSILPAVKSGKVDFAASGIAITEERAESVNFSIPYYTGGTMMAVLKSEETTIGTKSSEVEDNSFWGGIKSSFNKTFIREDRWELFANGILTTLLITALTIIFGTLLGFILFMLCRNGNTVANIVTSFCLWLVQGMPVVVLLMILYYVIFGSVAISGVFVAVIGFTLTFGASVFGLLKMGVGAVDNGQYEASYALGYSNRRTFFRIILPQALTHVMSAYKGEIVSLIKATAIVGYIAVQDLTKMGDIVRSRTYEAFFPLIAVTVIYFLLEALIGLIISRISVNFNPKHRKTEVILKGVKTDD